jgi:hypothetical protein
LDRPGPHRQHVRRGCARRIHDWNSHCGFRHLTLVGFEQCGGDAGGPELGRGTSRARRESRLAHRTT